MLTPLTAGRVGSLLGLNPYSSTSFRRSSSASFRCFRRRHQKSAAKTISATPTIGTTTATAMRPPFGSPPLSSEAPALGVAREPAAEVELVAAAEEVMAALVFCVATGAGAVDVISIVSGP